MSLQLAKFQSTLPRGERHRQILYKEVKFYISIHAPARGATQTALANLGCHKYFNPRSREGSDNLTRIFIYYCDRFQSTLPRGERLHKPYRTWRLFPFQSTLPRGERPVLIQPWTPDIKISIHAPARGATSFSFPIWLDSKISIHAPARGATPKLTNFYPK